MNYIVVALIVIATIIIFGYFLTSKQRPPPPPQNPERPARVYHEEECPICLDKKIFPVQASCAHEFCADCILSALDKSSSCPMCRRTISILFKNFEECPPELNARLRTFIRLNEERSYFQIICDAPLLLKRFFTHNDYHDTRTSLGVIALIVICVFYLTLEHDILDESKYGLFGLIDDFGVVGGCLIYASILIFKAVLASA